MQLLHATLLSYIEEAVRDAWDVTAIHNDGQRVAMSADQLPKARIALLPGITQAAGGAAAAREAQMPHTYEITGMFAYPTGDTTVSVEAAEKWNALAAQLTTAYPKFKSTEWAYSEEFGWEFTDQAEERTYTVTLTFTVFVITPVLTT